MLSALCNFGAKRTNGRSGQASHSHLGCLDDTGAKIPCLAILRPCGQACEIPHLTPEEDSHCARDCSEPSCYYGMTAA